MYQLSRRAFSTKGQSSRVKMATKVVRFLLGGPHCSKEHLPGDKRKEAAACVQELNEQVLNDFKQLSPKGTVKSTVTLPAIPKFVVTTPEGLTYEISPINFEKKDSRPLIEFNKSDTSVIRAHFGRKGPSGFAIRYFSEHDSANRDLLTVPVSLKSPRNLLHRFEPLVCGDKVNREVFLEHVADRWDYMTAKERIECYSHMKLIGFMKSRKKTKYPLVMA